jgi:hypothetical protein
MTDGRNHLAVAMNMLSFMQANPAIRVILPPGPETEPAEEEQPKPRARATLRVVED